MSDTVAKLNSLRPDNIKDEIVAANLKQSKVAQDVASNLYYQKPQKIDFPAKPTFWDFFSKKKLQNNIHTRLLGSVLK